MWILVRRLSGVHIYVVRQRGSECRGEAMMMSRELGMVIQFPLSGGPGACPMNKSRRPNRTMNTGSRLQEVVRTSMITSAVGTGEELLRPMIHV